MTRLYPDVKKDDRTRVTCMSCEGLDLYDRGTNSWCWPGAKNIQEDELYKKRVCRRHQPGKVKRMTESEDGEVEDERESSVSMSLL